MAAPDPTNLQVQAPAAVAPAPAQPDPATVAPHDTESMRDRILTPEETESLLRGQLPESSGRGGTDDPAVTRTQEEMATDFFRAVPPDTPGGPSPDQPAQLTPEQMQQNVQQQLEPTPVVQPTPAAVQQQIQQPATQPATQPVATPQEAALQAQNQMLMQQLSAMQQQITQMGQQQQQVQPAQQQQQRQQQLENKFNFQVPSSHMVALSAEDPTVRQQALDSLLSGVANTVYSQIRQEMDQQITERVPQQVQQQVSAVSQQQRVSQDMYGTYPELAAHSNLVYATADQLNQQGLGAAGWTPDFRDMVAERLAPLVPGLSQKVQQTRAKRGAIAQAQGQMPLAPAMQQPQQVAPVALPPGSLVGGVHGAPSAQPMLIRDQNGNLIPMVPAQQVANGPQARQNGGVQVDPAIADIWNTLGYTR